MQRAEVVLGALRKCAEDKSYTFARLYRHLYNGGLYALSSSGQDAKLADLIDQLRSERYYPDPDRGTLRDQWVERGVFRLLQAIYPSLEQPNPIERVLVGVANASRREWALQVCWGAALPTLPWGQLHSALRQRISDGRFLELLRRFFQARGGTGIIGGALQEVYGQWLVGRLRLERGAFLHRWQSDWLILGTAAGSWREQHYQLGQTLLSSGLASAVAQVKVVTDVRQQQVEFCGYEVLAKPDRCLLLLPGSALRQRLRQFARRGRPVARDDRLSLPPAVILALYRRELIDLAQCFNMADNVKPRLRHYHYYHWNSLLKTLAKKEKRSLQAVASKYRLRLSGGEEGLASNAGGTPVFYPAQVAGLFSA